MITKKSKQQVPQVIQTWLKWREPQSHWEYIYRCGGVTFLSITTLLVSSLFLQRLGTPRVTFPRIPRGLSTGQSLDSIEVSSAEWGEAAGSRCLIGLFLLLVELFDLIPKPHLLSIRMPRDKMAGCASYDVRVTVPWLQHWCWVSVSRDSLAIGEAVPLLVIHPFFVTLRYILENSAMFLWSRMFWWSRKLETNDCLSCPGPGAFQHTQEEEGRTLEGSLSRPSSASTTVLTGGAPYTKPEVRWGGNKQARTGRHYRKLLLASRLVLVAPADSCQFSGGLAVSAGLCHHGWFMSGTLTLLNWAAGILKMEIKIASKNYF